MVPLLLAAALAVEPPAAPPPAPKEPGILAAAGWCVLRSDEVVEEEDLPGCDLGMGVKVLGKGRLSWVAVVGAETVGTGLAWVVSGSGRPVVAIAVGVVVRYDEHGIDATEVFPALGATLSLRGGI